VCARLRAAGLPLEPLLQKAGLSIEQIDDPDRSLTVRSQIKLLKIAAEALDDDLLGFHLARDFELREVGLLYYVLVSSSSFTDALANAQRYTGIVNEGVTLSFRTDRAAVIELNYVGVERESDRQQIEFWIGAIVRLCRQMTGTRIAPLDIKVRHVRDGMPEELRAFLGCDVTFGATTDEIVLPKHVNSLPIVATDQYLNNILVKYAEDALQRRAATQVSLRSRVEKAIALLLPHGRAKAATVARELGMSHRALARSLAAEETSFSRIMDQYRDELARAYLTHDNLPISQVAWLLGYQEVSAFTHAFRRWCGMTPGQWRARQDSYRPSPAAEMRRAGLGGARGR
jgi:AraC-like DNA-binding protein